MMICEKLGLDHFDALLLHGDQQHIVLTRKFYDGKIK